MAAGHDFSNSTVLSLLEGLIPVTDELTIASETCAIFFQDLVSVLTSISFYHPSFKNKTEQLVTCINLMLGSMNNGNVPAVSYETGIGRNRNINTPLNRFIEQLKTIDDQIYKLMGEKKKLYHHFQNVGTNVKDVQEELMLAQKKKQLKNISSCAESGEEDSVIESDTGSDVRSQHFSEDIVKQSAENQKKHFKIKTELENKVCSNCSPDKDHICDNDCYKFGQSSDIQLQPIVKLNVSNDTVTSMCVSKGRIFLGTLKGAIYFFVPGIYICEPTNIRHTLSVSALLMWDDCIVSSSYDGTVFLFPINNCSITKKASFRYGIHCMTELNGVLYLGSVNGYLFELNLRAFTQRNDRIVQVNCGFVAIKSGNCLGRFVLIILSIDNKVIVRSIATGELLNCISFDEPVCDLYVIEDGPFKCFCLSGNHLHILLEKKDSLTLERIHNDGGKIIVCHKEKVLLLNNFGTIQLSDIANQHWKYLRWNNNPGTTILSAVMWEKKLLMSSTESKNKLLILELPF